MTTVTREMIGAAHDVMLAKGDLVLSANLLERIYRAMRAREPKEGESPIVGAGDTAKTERSNAKVRGPTAALSPEDPSRLEG